MAMSEKEIVKRDVHGHAVLGDDSAKKGIDYLDHDLQYAEAEVFFRQAKMQGSAAFEDGENRNFTLTANGDGTYTVTARKPESGGFFSGWF